MKGLLVLEMENALRAIVEFDAVTRIVGALLGLTMCLLPVRVILRRFSENAGQAILCLSASLLGRLCGVHGIQYLY